MWNRLAKTLYRKYKQRLSGNQKSHYFIRSTAIPHYKSKLTMAYALLTIAVLIILIAIYLTLPESYNITTTTTTEQTVHLQSNIYGDSNEMEELLKFHQMDLYAINASRCVILLRESKGDLGNRMFMFASAYGLARIHACKMYVAQHILNELEASFHIWILHLITKNEMKNLTGIVSWPAVCKFFPELMKPNAVRYFELTGFWRSFGYFINFRSEILEQFAFRPSILRVVASYLVLWENQAKNCCFGHCFTSSSKTNIEMCSMSPNFTHKIVNIPMNTAYLKQYVSTSHFTWIGIHVKRRRLYKDSLSSEAYIFNAMKYFSKKYRNCIFIMASEDKDYCARTFSKVKNIIITPKHFSSSEDLAMLALCQHSIITVGTLGWWSAFLAGGTVIHNVRYVQNRSTIYDCNYENYFPPWFLLPT